MKHTSKYYILLILAFSILGLSLLTSACEPELPLKINNQTDASLIIYVQSQGAGKVESDKTTRITGIPMTLSHYLIEAKTSNGAKIYSRNFSTAELHDLNWVVTITSP